MKKEKMYRNTPKGRSEIPNKPGKYDLKNKNRKTIYSGIARNLNRRIKEHHYGKTLRFSYISIVLN